MNQQRWAGAILALGLSCFLLVAYPGFTSPDSISQLTEARRGVYSDWHPPFMAFVWRYLDMLWSGTFLMLVLQSTTFLLGAYALLARTMVPKRAAVVAVCVLLFPPIFTPMAVIWKDSQMAGYVLAGTAALISPRLGWKLVGCVLLFVATAVRHNALAATLPIVFFLFTCRGWAGWRRYLAATVVWAAITSTASFANKKLTTLPDYPWHNSVAYFDIAGTALFSHELDDAKLREMLDGVPLAIQTGIAKRLRYLYAPDAWWQLSHGEERVFELPRRDQLAGIPRAWKRLVTTYPRAFLYHRLLVFRELIGLARPPPAPVWYGQPAVTPSSTPMQYAWFSTLDALGGTPLFRVFIYLAVSFALLALCRARLPLALLASGLTIELSLLAAAPSSDYRYSHWMIVTTVVAGIMIFVQRYRAGRVASAP